jgi:hypothetical protein
MYGTIDREELWAIMPFELIRSFESKSGLCYGDELSTKLFNVALEGTVRRSKVDDGLNF